VAQAAHEGAQNFGGFTLRGVVALHEQDQFAVRVDPSRVFNQHTEQASFRGREVFDLIFLLDKAAG